LIWVTFWHCRSKALAEAKEPGSVGDPHRETVDGVTVTRYWKARAIEYKTIPELDRVDVEKYRGAPRQETRITVVEG